MKKSKTAISPASASLPSGIKPKSMTPALPGTPVGSTIGITLDADGAKQLAAMLLSVSYDRDSTGNIHITGHIKENRITVIRKNK